MTDGVGDFAESLLDKLDACVCPAWDMELEWDRERALEIIREGVRDCIPRSAVQELYDAWKPVTTPGIVDEDERHTAITVRNVLGRLLKETTMISDEQIA